MVHSLFETLNPTAAFRCILRFLMKQSDTRTHILASLSVKEVCDFFSNIIEAADPDGALYGRVDILATEEKLLQVWDFFDQDIRDDIAEFLFRPASIVLFPRYNFSIFPFYKTVVTEEGEILEELEEDENFTVLLESVLQQLTQGKGLLCPFWFLSPYDCCSSRNREFLEKVWSCAKPESSLKFWGRLGCLDE